MEDEMEIPLTWIYYFDIRRKRDQIGESAGNLDVLSELNANFFTKFLWGRKVLLLRILGGEDDKWNFEYDPLLIELRHDSEINLFADSNKGNSCNVVVSLYLFNHH